jgi:hypothetical protein
MTKRLFQQVQAENVVVHAAQLSVVGDRCQAMTSSNETAEAQFDRESLACSCEPSSA